MMNSWRSWQKSIRLPVRRLEIPNPASDVPHGVFIKNWREFEDPILLHWAPHGLQVGRRIIPDARP